MSDSTPEIDRETVHEIVVEDQRISSPYADLDTLIAKLEALFPYLIDVAREEETTDYWTVKDECGIFTARQSYVLGILGLHEDEQERPLLSAVVTSSETGMAGEKYFDMVRKARNETTTVPDREAERRRLWDDHRRDVYEYWAE